MPIPKGTKFTEEHKKRISESNKGKISFWRGKKHTQEYKDKMSEAQKGHIISEETKKKISLAQKGKKYKLGYRYSEERKAKMCGENHSQWKGGISKNPYPKEFTPELKLKIRKRDKFTCCLCRRTEMEELEELNRVLCVNHIDYDKNNCSDNNLNTLCVRCNIKINRERDYWTNYFIISNN